MKRGDRLDKRDTLPPPYLRAGKHRIPLDILAFVLGLILVFFNQQIAVYLPAKSSDLLSAGELLLLVGSVFFIFGRIELKK